MSAILPLQLLKFVTCGRDKSSYMTQNFVHYNDVIMGAMASQLTSLTIVYSTVYSHQGSASLTFVRGIHRWPVNSPHKWPVTRRMFPFDDVIMGIWFFRSGNKTVTRLSYLPSGKYHTHDVFHIESPQVSPKATSKINSCGHVIHWTQTSPEVNTSRHNVVVAWLPIKLKQQQLNTGTWGQ